LTLARQHGKIGCMPPRKTRRAIADLDELNVPGNDDPEFAGQEVAVYINNEDGSAGLRPASFDRLRPHTVDVLAELQRTVAARRRLADYIAHLVPEAREAGASWAQIGWSVGTSGEAARQRWGAEVE
jgi:hypothetical protein